jgi:hypothetical protein
MLDDRALTSVKWAIALGLVASLAHFADNAIHIARYPEPAWISPGVVLLAWLPIAVIAAAALLRRGDCIFVLLTAVFGALLLSGLAHYSYGSPGSMAPSSNATIMFEALTGVAVLGALGLALRARSA